MGKPIGEMVMAHELREAKVSQANRSKWQRKADANVAGLERFDKVFTSD